MQYPIRYDEFDYQKFGAQKRWLYIPTAAMLTSYEMEIKGCHEKENSWNIHLKILEKYKEYLSNLMFEGTLDYNNGKECNYTKYDPFEDEQVIMHNSANFNKDDCLAAIAGNNIFNIDLAKLTNVIYGKEPLPGANCESVASMEANSSSIDLPEDMAIKIKTYSETELRKKVVELTNEKHKWDKSIVAALKVGLLIKMKGLDKDFTEKTFAAEFENELKGLAKKTVDMIRKAIPVDYRNTGGNPPKESEGLDDDTLDLLIETSVAAGLIISKEDVKNAKELESQLARFDFKIPQDQHLRIISGACRRVSKQYKQVI